jgi:hypothetical protein
MTRQKEDITAQVTTQFMAQFQTMFNQYSTRLMAPLAQEHHSPAQGSSYSVCPDFEVIIVLVFLSLHLYIIN